MRSRLRSAFGHDPMHPPPLRKCDRREIRARRARNAARRRSIVKSRVLKWPAAMRESAPQSTPNSLARMVSITRCLAFSRMAGKSRCSPEKSRQVESSCCNPLPSRWTCVSTLSHSYPVVPATPAKRGHHFPFAENFLDDDVKRRRQSRLAAGFAHKLVQPLRILAGVAQTVDMVEPQSLQLSGRDQSRDQRMDCSERGRIFDADSGEVVDIEKAPVIDRRKCDAPVCDPIVLALEQAMQQRGTVIPR